MVFDSLSAVRTAPTRFPGALNLPERWAASLLLAVCILALGMPAHADVQPLDRVVAVVDNDIVLQSELDERLAQVVNRMRQQNVPMPPLNLLRKRVLDQLIMENIQLQKAEQAGLRVSDNQLNETMARIAQDSKMTLDQFQEALRSEGVSYAHAREQIRREMVIGRYQQRRVESRIDVSESEVQAYLQSAEGKTRASEEYRLGHILVSLPDQPSQQQIEAARNEAQDIRRQLQEGADFRQLASTHSDAQTALEGGDLGWRSAHQLPTLFADVVPKLQVGQVSEPLQAASGFHLVMVQDKRGGASQIVEQSRVRHILVRPTEIRSEQEAEQLIHDLYRQVTEKGADFGEVAKAYSDDPGSASTGGELQWVSPGEMVPEFEQVMRASAINAVSAPFQSQFGWHILQVLERRQQDVGERVQEAQVRQILFRRKFEEELESWLREVREDAYIEIKDTSLS